MTTEITTESNFRLHFGNLSARPNTLVTYMNDYYNITATVESVVEIRVTTPLEYATAFVSIFAIFVNLCVLLVIFIGPRAFRNPTFFFISSLATADLLTGVTVLFAIFLPISDRVWERIALKGMAVVSFSASVNSLVVIAADRYVKIRDDSRYKKIFTNLTSGILIAITWLIAITVFLGAPLLGWSCADGRCACAEDGMCQCDPESCSQSFPPFTLSYIGMGIGYFYVSLVMMIALYSGLFITVRRRAGSQHKRHGSVVGAVPNQGPFVMIHRRREIRLAKTLVIVMGVFFICWLPVTSLFIYDVSTTRSDIIKWFDYCLTSAVIHPLVNPIIYSMRLPRMWITFKHLAYALWRRTARKPMYPYPYPSRLSRTPSTRTYVTSMTSRTSSFRSSKKSPPTKNGPSLSTGGEILMVGPSSKAPHDVKDPFFDEDCVFLPNPKNLKRSTSLQGGSQKGRAVRARESFRNSMVCKNSDRYVIGDQKQRSINQKPSRVESVRLHNGHVVAKESVSISKPFNPETKMAWS